jgi:hypothetical protein
LKKRTPHTNTFNAYAFFLALLIFTAFGGKEVHILLEHGHSDVEICHVEVGDTHLHAYEDLEHGCSLCDFTFSYFTFSLPQFTILKQASTTPKTTFTYFSHGLFLHPSFVALRGPPVEA